VKLSVIILNYNVAPFLRLCLQSVQQAVSEINAEVIVVDNASSDDSCEMVKTFFPNVTLIKNPENNGFSAGNNIGVTAATGEYICLLNPDTVVGHNCFKDALDFAQSKDNLGALGVKMIDGCGNFLPESKRCVPTIKVSLKKLLGYKKAGYYASNLQPDQDGEVQILVGAFMLMRNDRYLEVKGLDEDFFMYGEDIDLSYKFLKAGYSNYYKGSTAIIHYKGESTVKNKAYYDRFYSAMHIFYSKHFSKNPLTLPLLKVAVGILKLLKSGSPKSSTKNEQVNAALLLSDNMALRKELTKLITLPISSLSKSLAMDGGITQRLLIFDSQYTSETQIIDLMQLLKGNGNRFRIYPKKSNFILGSDSSEHKGEIQYW
jgi:GT2 family glycosyltransferase